MACDANKQPIRDMDYHKMFLHFANALQKAYFGARSKMFASKLVLFVGGFLFLFFFLFQRNFP